MLASLLFVGLTAMTGVQASAGDEWGIPAEMPADGLDGFDSCVAINDHGDIMVAWAQSSSSEEYYTFDIIVKTCIGGTWSEPETIQTGLSTEIGLELVMIDNGNATLIWDQGGVYASTYNGSAWSDPIPIRSGTAVARGAHVAMDEQGNAMVIWQESVDGDKDNIFAKPYRDGDWGPAVTIQSEPSDAGNCHLAVDGAGNFTAVWIQSVPSGSDHAIWSNSYENGAWGEAEVISDGINVAYEPELAVNRDGVAIAVWQQENVINVINLYANIRSEGAWGEPFQVPTVSDCALSPHVAIDGQGDAVVLWFDSLTGTGNLYATSLVGGSWDEPAVVGQASVIPRYTVVCNDDGDGVAVWFYPNNIRVALYSDGTWGASHSIPTGDIAIPGDLFLTINGDGVTALAWTQTTESLDEVAMVDIFDLNNIPPSQTISTPPSSLDVILLIGVLAVIIVVAVAVVYMKRRSAH